MLDTIKSKMLNDDSKITYIILKMKRDVLGISEIIKQINDDDNLSLVFPKDAIQDLLIRYLNTQLDFLESACKNEVSPNVEWVKHNLICSEYAKTKYSIRNDFDYWNDNANYDENELSEIHNSELSLNSVNAYSNSLVYNRLINSHCRLKGTEQKNYIVESILSDEIKKEIATSKEKYNNSLNKAIISLYDLYTYVNSLVMYILQGKSIKLCGNLKNQILEYFHSRFEQKHICEDAMNIQVDLFEKTEVCFKH